MDSVATVQQPCYGNRFRLVAMQQLSLWPEAAQYRGDQFPRKTGEIDSARVPHECECDLPFHECHYPPRVARALLSPSPSLPDPSNARVLCSSSPRPLLLLRSSCVCASITRCGSGKSFHASPSFSFRDSRASDWKKGSFFVFLNYYRGC